MVVSFAHAYYFVKEKNTLAQRKTQSLKKVPREVSVRWTPSLSKSWTPVSDVFLTHYTDLDITTQEAMLIIHLMRYKWGQEAPYPGFKTLAKMMGLSTTAVRGHARNLERKKLLSREIRVDDTNVFHLDPLFHALEQFCTKAEPVAF